ncbi:poly-gamma-glutamate biosynthesis protein PgsC/CapC [Pseudoalteromonas luteoviolacea]|uniref:Capsule biosynthesis CapC n=1 Tax=Pseudoalteromonas luteoviolacea H33 TaxID=1365251 RepID=A0A167EEJ1_9GAMM|nr:poly-gamma-glutamate biosynthesis protein PgsC/CapC [Pseudoalteromonas luteoviolacea]KZN50650.1 hypothetical protein N476_15285 [Pseudoalteromonas luteoviolacea H33]KZN77594.1 hypothetical protein N477_11530 [Pseudoalteromonas luteoviolacea H33-S]MBQ4877554.1 hypothetical protein [Pseudoalteromonas luteoviolacea]MBQ4906589.1 hypothetical protein [Pseudoalteromonas luteoviolacea]
MDWVLQLFPTGSGLGQSVITTVWVGIAVVCMLNLRFGFPLTGLVVPGYLVPLFIVTPISAVVIIIEAIVVYAVMLFSAKTIMERFGFSEMFGRDRFFAIILISILVRVVMDTLFWPLVAMYLAQWDITFDYSSQLYSLGLVIIALTANVMWNGGFKYGMRVTLIQLFVTYLLVRFMLMPFTNFSIANLAIMYEAVAASIVAAPKAYIILVITAFIASRANIKYGWEFNGIMLPALLALQLMQPTKLLTSFAETAVILILGGSILTFTRLRHANFEGARLLLFFFNIGFLYKIVLNYVVVHYYPTLKVTDTFAFGYMLSTLLALKIYQKNALGLVIRATFQTSIVGGLIAITTGFLIMFIPAIFATTPAQINSSDNTDIALSQQISAYKSYLYTQQSEPVSISQYQQAQSIQHFMSAIRVLNRDRQEQENVLLARRLLAQAQFSLYEDEQYLYIKDTDTSAVRGFFALSKQPSKSHIISVPYPSSERVASDAAGLLFELLGSDALVLGTQFTPSIATQQVSQQSPYYSAFFSVFEELEVLQIRSVNQYTRVHLQLSPYGVNSQFWIFNQLPTSLSQKQLTNLMGFERGQFGILHTSSMPTADFNGKMVEAYIDGASYSNLLSEVVLSTSSGSNVAATFIDTSLDEVIETFAPYISAKGSNHYQELTNNEAALWEFEILGPLYKLVAQQSDREFDQDELNRLARINHIANMMGYQLQIVDNDQAQYIVLAPLDKQESLQQGQGLYVINLHPSAMLNIQVPRPLFESNTLKFSGELFASTGAKALSIAGAHPYANEQANVMAPGNVRSLFNVVHQSTLRYFAEQPILSLQVRSHSAPSYVRPSAIAFQFTNPDEQHANTLKELQYTLIDLGVNTQVVSGQVQTRGLEIGTSPQSGYRLFSPISELATLWLASDFKQHFAISEQALLQRLLAVSRDPQVRSLNTLVLSPNDWLLDNPPSLEKVLKLAEQYSQDQHLPLLSEFCQKFPKCQLQAVRIEQSQQLALTIKLRDKLLAIYTPTSNKVLTIRDFNYATGGLMHVLD